MSTFIFLKTTDNNGSPVGINYEQIISMKVVNPQYNARPYTAISFTNGHFETVRETPEEIMEKIEENETPMYC